jgi:N-acetylmuramic acid 6-phosphate (MurNAc-6-P) etherase
MGSNNQVSISVDTIQEIVKELNEISDLCSTPHLRVKVERLQKLVSSFLDFKSKVSVEDVIYDKMVEVKNNNQDLHLKLYMLYRNLTNDRISEADAVAAYESYLSMFPTDIIIY